MHMHNTVCVFVCVNIRVMPWDCEWQRNIPVCTVYNAQYRIYTNGNFVRPSAIHYLVVVRLCLINSERVSSSSSWLTYILIQTLVHRERTCILFWYLINLSANEQCANNINCLNEIIRQNVNGNAKRTTWICVCREGEWRNVCLKGKICRKYFHLPWPNDYYERTIYLLNLFMIPKHFSHQIEIREKKMGKKRNR